MHDDAVRGEFTRQARSLEASPVHRAPSTLDAVVDMLPARPGERWLEAACGPGLVARTLAPRVASVHGVDLTPRMVELAREEAARAGLVDATFAVADATALPCAAASFDGAVTRFSLHHVPLPGRVVAELARVVRPGGHVAYADHAGSDELDAAAWHEQLERLRDPSHWSCLPPRRLRALGEVAGLELVEEHVEPFSLDFADWVARGSGGAANGALIAAALAERPQGAPSFRVEGGTLHLQLYRALWRVSR